MKGPTRRTGLITALIAVFSLVALAFVRLAVEGGDREAAPAEALNPIAGPFPVQIDTSGTRSPPLQPLQSPVPRRLTGVVASAGGGLLRGAEVCVIDSSEACCSSRLCAFSDEDGRFSLHWSGVRGLLLASAKDHAPWKRHLTASTDAQPADAIVITLEPGGAELSGSVIDATGGAIVGAVVTVRPAAQPADRASIETEESAVALLGAATVSDSSGAFRLRVPGVPLVVRAQAEAYSHGSLRLSPPFAEVTLVLVPGSEIVGSVRRAETDEPVGNATVVAVSKSGLRARAHVETGVDGEFSLRGLAAGAYEVTAASIESKSLPSLVSVGVGERSETVTLLVEATFTLSGRVSIGDEPCRRGSLMASGPSSGNTAIVDGQVASVGMLGGHYEITIDCDGAVPIEESIELRNDQTGRYWSSTPGISLRGRVESASGKSLPGASIDVYPLRSAGRGSRCVSDAAGEFSCGGLSPGEHRCSASDGYGTEAATADVTLSAASSPRVVLRAKPTGTIRGRFEGTAENHPRVYALEERGSPVEAVAQAGQFEFKGLPLGRYVIASTRPQQHLGSESASVSLERDGQIVDVQLRAPQWVTIRGRVIDERAAPVMDAWVRAALPLELNGDSFDSIPPVLTDDDGSFTLEHLVSGVYDIVASTGAGETTLRGVQSGAANVLIELKAYGALSGVVSNSVGEPVNSFELWYQTGTKQSRDQLHTEDGSWNLPGLPPGEYRVGVHSEFGDAVADVVLEPGKEATLALTVAPSQ
jgi:hypothetical protein